MQYPDYLVESSDDKQLIEMYANVRERLATGFVPEYIGKVSPRTDTGGV